MNRCRGEGGRFHSNLPPLEGDSNSQSDYNSTGRPLRHPEVRSLSFDGRNTHQWLIGPDRDVDESTATARDYADARPSDARCSTGSCPVRHNPLEPTAWANYSNFFRPNVPVGRRISHGNGGRKWGLFRYASGIFKRKKTRDLYACLGGPIDQNWSNSCRRARTERCANSDAVDSRVILQQAKNSNNNTPTFVLKIEFAF